MVESEPAARCAQGSLQHRTVHRTRRLPEAVHKARPRPPPRRPASSHEPSTLNGYSSLSPQAFFKKKQNGFYLELGALDGSRLSNTRFFEEHRSWQGLLIEANPNMFAHLRKIRGCSHRLQMAVCAKAQRVHFHTNGAFSGIFEFMSGFEKAGRRRLNTMPTVECRRLDWALDWFGVKHIDFFSLDVEGAELQVLQTIDLSRITVDVVVVETDGHNKTKDEEVNSLLIRSGLVKQVNDGHNTWYVRRASGYALKPPLSPARALSMWKSKWHKK
mmetsp:Transcript_60475/g.107812  ORF Transcript_60475/g.107812 Transcript_60475/m.107812 type:complete len:273 (-) Transcript_60475:1069-1887(-)